MGIVVVTIELIDMIFSAVMVNDQSQMETDQILAYERSRLSIHNLLFSSFSYIKRVLALHTSP
jgi:hypothetical protein